jgi:hypothetical protein
MTRQQQVVVDKHDTKIQGQEKELSALQKIAKTHQDDLSAIDLRAFDKVAEEWSIEWPQVQAAIKRLKEFQARLEKEGSTIVLAQDQSGRSTPTQVLSRQNSVLSTVPKDAADSSWADRVRAIEEELDKIKKGWDSGLFAAAGQLDKLTGRVRSLEEGVKTPQSNPQIDPLMKIRMEAFLAQVPTLAQSMNSLRDQVAGLIRREGEAQKSLQQGPLALIKAERVEEAYKDLANSISDSLTSLYTQVTALDSQYNNINTKTLAESMVVQMEQIYPGNRQVLANQEFLSKEVQKVETQSKQCLEGIEDLKRQWASTMSPRLGVGNKRRRTEEVLDAHNTGSRRSSGSPGNPGGQ